MTHLDELVSRLERRWGIDRLPLLVDEVTAARFQKARDIYRGEMEVGVSHERRQRLMQMMVAAWTDLDTKATAAGAQPLPPACFEAEWAPGRVFAIASDDAHRQTLVLRNKAEGRDHISIFTIADVAQLIDSIPDVARIYELFPGAYVSTPPAASRGGKRKMHIADEIPFGQEVGA